MSKYDFIPVKQNKEETLEVDYSKSDGSLIGDTNSEIQSLRNLFIANNDVDKENKRKEKVNSSKFWCAIYFQDEDQKNEFFDKINSPEFKNKQYISGLEFAKKINVKIEKKEIKTPKQSNRFKL